MSIKKEPKGNFPRRRYDGYVVLQRAENLPRMAVGYEFADGKIVFGPLNEVSPSIGTIGAALRRKFSKGEYPIIYTDGKRNFYLFGRERVFYSASLFSSTRDFELYAVTAKRFAILRQRDLEKGEETIHGIKYETFAPVSRADIRRYHVRGRAVPVLEGGRLTPLAVPEEVGNECDVFYLDERNAAYLWQSLEVSNSNGVATASPSWKYIPVVNGNTMGKFSMVRFKDFGGEGYVAIIRDERGTKVAFHTRDSFRVVRLGFDSFDLRAAGRGVAYLNVGDTMEYAVLLRKGERYAVLRPGRRKVEIVLFHDTESDIRVLCIFKRGRLVSSFEIDGEKDPRKVDFGEVELDFEGLGEIRMGEGAIQMGKNDGILVRKKGRRYVLSPLSGGFIPFPGKKIPEVEEKTAYVKTFPDGSVSAKTSLRFVYINGKDGRIFRFEKERCKNVSISLDCEIYFDPPTRTGAFFTDNSGGIFEIPEKKELGDEGKWFVKIMERGDRITGIIAYAEVKEETQAEVRDMFACAVYIDERGTVRVSELLHVPRANDVTAGKEDFPILVVHGPDMRDGVAIYLLAKDGKWAEADTDLAAEYVLSRRFSGFFSIGNGERFGFYSFDERSSAFDVVLYRPENGKLKRAETLRVEACMHEKEDLLPYFDSSNASAIGAVLKEFVEESVENNEIKLELSK